ncbi:hypothetical protein T4B_3674 [Trichinella pseudospiralis]|uniref:Uncharacterized protein n=1 Tax=Trichinella pseudospiralis TaxID=6337 RepID=A0A0V1IAI0_TRIPS|nr:hypothetical protein T4B_3674 [Trichinella pseudospiralis]KRZ35885.1 hypothetical protein T4C_9046 [Trichinella pseudospiralis]
MNTPTTTRWPVNLHLFECLCHNLDVGCLGLGNLNVENLKSFSCRVEVDVEHSAPVVSCVTLDVMRDDQVS